MDMPPTRYKVVERGRRLIVVDAQSGAPVTGLDRDQQARIDGLRQRLDAPEPRRSVPVPPPAPRPSLSSASPPSASPFAADDKILTTQEWFDDKAPRRLRIGQNHQTGLLAAVVGFFVVGTAAFFILGWPALVVAGFFLSYKAVRQGIRGAITRWLDGFEQVD
jgi:hypothetical protein